MTDQSGDLRRELLQRIDGRRASIDDYLQRARPRGGRLVTVAIVSSALAAVLTAGPALGGEPFAAGVADSLALPSESVNAELEGLRTLVTFGQVSVGDAAKQYQQFVTKIPWVDERHPVPSYDQVGAQASPYPGGPPPGWGPPGPPQQGWNRPSRQPTQEANPYRGGPQS